MTASEMFFRTIEFFFNSTWHFIQLLILVLMIQGVLSKWYKNISSKAGDFFRRVKYRYEQKLDVQENHLKKPATPEYLKKLMPEKDKYNEHL